MKLKIIQIGKTKDAWLCEGIAEYRKRLSAFVNLEVLELADYSIKYENNPSEVKTKEGESILKHLSKDDFVVLMDERGDEKSSLEFADFLINILDRKRIVFVIGGVFGVNETVSKRSNLCLALSRLTFTHRMARLILMEQIYRAMMIWANRAYHV